MGASSHLRIGGTRPGPGAAAPTTGALPRGDEKPPTDAGQAPAPAANEAMWESEWRALLLEDEDALLNLEWLAELAASQPDGSTLGLQASDRGGSNLSEGVIVAAVGRMLTTSIVPAVEGSRRSGDLGLSDVAQRTVNPGGPQKSAKAGAGEPSGAGSKAGAGGVRSLAVYDSSASAAALQGAVGAPGSGAEAGTGGAGLRRDGPAGSGKQAALPFVLRGRMLLGEARPLLSAARVVCGEDVLRRSLQAIVAADDTAEAEARAEERRMQADDEDAAALATGPFAAGHGPR
ncbi:hypothetical protein FNF29_02159 [Cafeteria roenbergensis]|uniref:Uncharacterized protein n=1 Tax=Cafeteria roenbergensis TaxID=33653 RepID=A0A5A8CPN9_CAFRO|nr:hypothetical protein FNF29_02159 [Cafeteria roenbergensis]|eukprot:KAA0155016.1 hypothetical protein FNF29_02159 [Cafeteria roenbergensis]